MIRVNLLPHRQIRREARQREFGLMALFSAVTACAILFMAYTIINSKVDSQLERNQRLNNAITKLDKEIADIKDLREQISAMLERKQVVENLQTNRSQSVIVFDEISRQLPEGMYIKSIKQEGKVITLEGVADTNARVATLVRNFNQSEWMESPILIEIKAITVGVQKQNLFTLKVSLKTPITETDDAGAKATAGSARKS
ncbi:PilN domain-containing protein [Methylotenera mobilis]|jgi:type IV pilus assembly protein PilN|uniref:Fimbrial protein n=1 Tax=Methylotenera mobilis TaxID=359408 RepID=A0A351R9X4_9PROT|nr:PilN domain-containing protein [Methylotenera mobilis]PPC97549.1 MAG: fimbrial protein [Methylotenera sp.]PPD46314.1 MAG: fimbrial protein [Methylotenera sp.]HBA08845.1 fimbrial protein [Methylotenera mobilis]